MDSRFLHIQIYNETGTEVEYDNLIDTDWGIQVASASLNSQIMEKELRFGEMFSSMFQVVLYNLDVDLKGRRIKVGLNYNTGNNCIVDGNGNVLLVDDETYLVYREMADVSQVMFDGYIISSTKDRQGSDRTILAYDSLYTLRDINVADFWNEYWEDNETSTLEDFRNALLTYVNLSPVSDDFINDDLVVQNHFDYDLTQLRFQDLMKMICELQNTCPHLNPNTRNLDFISLRTVALHDIRQKVEGQNSSWEDFTTEQITGVGVYITGGELAQIVGESDNVYNLVGNVFLNGASAEMITEACTNILAELSTIQFVPGSFKLILSEPDWNLGDKIYSKYGMSYMFATKFSGSVLIDETISCKQSDAFLNKNVESYNDKIIEGLKVAQIEKTVDNFKIDYQDFKEDVSTEFEQTAEKIVMKVDDNGNVGIAELGSDEVDETYMKFKANKVEITSDAIQFDNDGYEVRGDIYKTIISPDEYKVQINYPNFDEDFFNPTINEFNKDLYKHIMFNNYSFIEWQNRYEGDDPGKYQRLEAYNSLSIISPKMNGYIDDDDETELDNIACRTTIGEHFLMTNAHYEEFINDGGTIDSDGYLVFQEGMVPGYYIERTPLSIGSYTNVSDNIAYPIVIGKIHLSTLLGGGGTVVNDTSVCVFYDPIVDPVYFTSTGILNCWGVSSYYVSPKYIYNSIYANNSGSVGEGYLMHGTDTAHKYACNWTGSRLNFYVDVTNVGYVSDKRLKDEIEEVNPNLVKAICECKTYQYKAFNRGGLISVGIIAQDFVANCEKYGVDPMAYEVCQKTIFKADDDTEYYSIEYSQYLTLKSIYLQNQIDELQSLKDEIAELKSDIEDLKKAR